MTILVGLLPSVMARKAIAARTQVAQAFQTYLHGKGVDQASILAQRRAESSRKHGVSVGDSARYEIGNALALLVNTAPGTFWVLFLIYADHNLLEEIREEVGSVVTQKADNMGVTRHIVGIFGAAIFLFSIADSKVPHRTSRSSRRPAHFSHPRFRKSFATDPWAPPFAR